VSQRVSLSTLGCKTNQFESAAMQERLEQAGYTIVPFAQAADLVIVNTCTVTAATDAQSRRIIRRARRLNPSCRVVVTGCYAQVDPGALAALPEVSLILGNEEKVDFLERLEQAGSAEDGVKIDVSDIETVKSANVPTLVSYAERSRAFIQIQNGCDAYCSYCIIPYARGRSRSVPEGQVVDQVKSLLAQGFNEVVLTGIHIGGYGLDFSTPGSLLSLIKRIEAETDLSRLRLGSIEPNEIHPELIAQIASSSIICRHLHIPLQSGDSAVLKRMNRHYTADDFRDLISAITSAIPDISLGLDVITGFPGETEEEFKNSHDLIESLPISSLHVFPFSRRSGTPAATMPKQVPERISRERAATLRSLSELRHKRYAQLFVGKTVDVIVEHTRQNAMQKGMTRHYLPVSFHGESLQAGSLVQIKIERYGPNGLIGRLLG
jgi:threonylcarbamoyladenosine tRNA methylthiotransferase MtaB